MSAVSVNIHYVKPDGIHAVSRHYLIILVHNTGLHLVNLLDKLGVQG